MQSGVGYKMLIGEVDIKLVSSASAARGSWSNSAPDFEWLRWSISRRMLITSIQVVRQPSLDIYGVWWGARSMYSPKRVLRCSGWES